MKQSRFVHISVCDNKQKSNGFYRKEQCVASKISNMVIELQVTRQLMQF